MFHFFSNKSRSAVINARLSEDPTNGKSSGKTTIKSRYLATYPQIVNILLGKYAIDEIIADEESAIA